MNKLVLIVLRWVVGGIFVFAGALKIFDPAGFAADIANYRMVPHDAIHLMAIMLPWVEFVVGIMLVIGVWVRASALVLTALMVIFLGGIGQALARGLDIRCGCFGTVEAGKIGAKELLRDVGLLAMSGWIYWRTPD